MQKALTQANKEKFSKLLQNKQKKSKLQPLRQLPVSGAVKKETADSVEYYNCKLTVYFGKNNTLQKTELYGAGCQRELAKILRKLITINVHQ